MMLLIWRNLCALAILSVLSGSAVGQGVLLPQENHDEFVLPQRGMRIPTNRTSYRLESIIVDANIDGQIARTSVSQTFRNTGSRQLQVSFVFPLPYDGAVDRLTFMVNGKELEAKLLDAKQARSIYEGYVRRNKDPALLEWVGTGLFKTSVFPIPAGEERTVTLQYSQLLRKSDNAVDYLFPLATAKYTAGPVKVLKFRVAINSQHDLKNIYSPTHDVKIKRDGDRNAVIQFSAHNTIPTNDLRLIYGTSAKDVGANVISYWPKGHDNGYFVLLASPKIKNENHRKQAKNVVFVIDRSGSMNGVKIEQARKAAKFVMNNLNEHDLFNIVAYDSNIDSFVPELERFNATKRSEGIGFINGIHSGGSTNIDGALTTALASITNDSRPSYIVFLTDGLPTVGEKNELRIVANAVENNKHRTRLISFGVGYDVNSRLIDRLTRENNGQSEYVRPDEDIEASVSRLYEKIASPVMSNVVVDYKFPNTDLKLGAIANRVYPSDAFDLFAGQQLVVVGRYQKSGRATITLKGRIGDEETTFTYDANFARKGQGGTNKYVEKLWANRRIGEIIDLIDLNGQNNELTKELVELSKRHGILTPYTSFLADENEAAHRFADLSANLGQANDGLKSLAAGSGEEAFRQRSAKSQFKSAKRVAAPEIAIGGRERQSVIVGRDAGGLRGGGQGGGQGGAGFGGGGIRKAGNGTLYKKGKLLFAENASDVDVKDPKVNLVKIKRFSKAYFQLVSDNSDSENKMMAAQRDGEILIIRLRKVVYRIE